MAAPRKTEMNFLMPAFHLGLLLPLNSNVPSVQDVKHIEDSYLGFVCHVTEKNEKLFSEQNYTSTRNESIHLGSCKPKTL
mgnify:CR=1 FL=1